MNYSYIKNELFSRASVEKQQAQARFFKTKKGQYGEGDLFMGINNPEIRLVLKQNPHIQFQEIEKLLQDEYHECRLFSLLFLVRKFTVGTDEEKRQVYDFYLTHTKHINNWDLVDSSAYKILGQYLIKRPRHVLYTLAESPVLFEQRISIVATYAFIQRREFSDTFQLADILLNHPHDLIQKAVGWMLKEVGKRNKEQLECFLLNDFRYKKMPRTMLRISLEKFSKEEKLFFMSSSR